MAKPVRLSPAAFRARVEGLLRELDGTGAVQLVAAVWSFGRRQLEAERAS